MILPIPLYSRRISPFLIALVVGLAVTFSQAQEELNLFVPVALDEAGFDMPDVDQETVRRVDIVEMGQEDALSEYLNSHKSDTFAITLFPQDINPVRLILEPTTTEIQDGKIVVWNGNIKGDSFGQFFFREKQDGRLIGSITAYGNAYEVSSFNDLTPIVQLKPEGFDEDGTPVESQEMQDESAQADDDPVPSLVSEMHSVRESGFLQPTEIDVLVAYTTMAKEEDADLLENIEIAFDQTNLAFKNQGINIKLNPLQVVEVSYNAGGSIDEIDLERLTRPDDGVLDVIHRYRDEFGADLVSLWVPGNPGTYCGLANIWTDAVLDFAALAFSIVRTDCAVRPYKYSFAHEITHNFGGRHDEDADPKKNPYPFAHGYVLIEHEVTDVMAYSKSCEDRGITCNRQLLWSDPTYKVEPTGAAFGTNDRADLLTLLNMHAPMVAEFRSRNSPSCSSTLESMLSSQSDFLQEGLEAIGILLRENLAKGAESNVVRLSDKYSSVIVVHGTPQVIGDNLFVEGSFLCLPNSRVQLLFAESGITAKFQLGGDEITVEVSSDNLIFSGQDRGQPLSSSQRNGTKQKLLASAAQPRRAYPLPNGAPVIDVMVVYTPNAAQGSSDIELDIASAIDEVNVSFQNSGVNTRLRLVHTEQVNYEEVGSTYTTDLERLTRQNDRQLDEIHSLRAQHKADVVSLWVGGHPMYCSNSHFMRTPGIDFADSAFTVVNRECALAKYSFAHEIGHILGASHEASLDTVSPDAENHGYISIEGQFMTIMAYGYDSSGPVCDCVRIPYWSNPNRTFDGFDLGADNAFDALTLSRNARIVSAFK